MYFEVNFMWRNILTVIQKVCGFVEIRVILCVYVCMFEIVVLQKYCG